jgi:uncharacterized protein YgiM (DUF1202 family)
MESKYGFHLFTIAEFEEWIAKQRVARTVLYLQQHHTYSPNYTHFKNNNHFELQRSMKNYHVNSNGWADIGQHFTIFPDGTIMTGRSLEKSPACITNNNANAICFEHIGNFDIGGDQMSEAQKSAIIRATAAVCKRFNIPINTDKIVYHHWFRLNNGIRNNGAGGNKSCPGTNFFGGNKVEDCQANFIPLVKKALKKNDAQTPVHNSTKDINYVVVTASSLNVRTKPTTSAPKATDRENALFGSILRVFDEKDGWYKITNNSEHWVSGQYTKLVKRAIVTADVLNVRNQPSTKGLKLGTYLKNEEVFVYESKNGWCRTDLIDKWVSADYLKFQ